MFTLKIWFDTSFHKNAIYNKIKALIEALSYHGKLLGCKLAIDWQVFSDNKITLW